MKIAYWVPIAVVVVAAPGFAADVPDTPGIPAQMVVTVRPTAGSVTAPTLEPGELTVLQQKAPVPVVGLQRLSGKLANLQLFVLMDDSTRSSSLGVHIPELKSFLESLPATTQVAIGYMRNGSFSLKQAFTTDHAKAAAAVQLPMAIPGGNGSPYFALSDLVRHWPSQEAAPRRAVLMLTDGVDRYWGTAVMDDPYVDEAIRGSLKKGVLIYTIYLRGAGLYGRGAWTKDFAQSHLMQVASETGGNAYFETFSDPVAIAPFLKDLQNRFDNQYEVTIRARDEKGVQPVKVTTELPGAKVVAPTRIYVP